MKTNEEKHRKNESQTVIKSFDEVQTITEKREPEER